MKSANRSEPLPSWWQHASLQTGIGANKNPNRSKPFAPMQEKHASQSGMPTPRPHPVPGSEPQLIPDLRSTLNIFIELGDIFAVCRWRARVGATR